MDIMILGKEKQFTDILVRHTVQSNMNFMSVRSYSTWGELFQRTESVMPSLLLIIIQNRQFNIHFQKAVEMLEKHPRLIVVFLCDYTLPNWKKKAYNRRIYFSDKKKEYVAIVADIEKIIKWKDNKDSCDLEFDEFLTPREEEIIQLVRLGRKQESIALELKISRKTVQNHLANIAQKFNTTSHIESVLRAVELGIIEPNYESSDEF